MSNDKNNEPLTAAELISSADEKIRYGKELLSTHLTTLKEVSGLYGEMGKNANINIRPLREQAEENRKRKEESLKVAEQGVKEYMKYLNSPQGEYIRNHYIMALDDLRTETTGTPLTLISALAYFKPIDLSEQVDQINRLLKKAKTTENVKRKTSIFELTPEEQNKLIEEILQMYDSFTTSSECEDFTETLENLNSILPNQHIIANHKTANKLTALTQPARAEINVGTKQKPVRTYMTLFDDNNITVKGSKPFTEYDRNVFDSVVSLFESGNKKITPEMVYRAMVHDTSTTYIQPQTIDTVNESLQKMSLLRVSIDGTEECQRRGFEQAQWFREGYLLPLNKDVVIANGEIRTCYSIIEKPILYSYSQQFKQVITVPPDVLDIYEVKGKKLTGKIANTDKRIVIKSYLIREIEKIKKDKRKPTILFDTLYETVLEKATPKTKQSTREYTELCLASWKATGYIEKYERVKLGKTITGVKVYCK